MKIYVISLTTANSLRVLQRVATVFSRQRINIDQLNVHETAHKGIAHFSITISTESYLVDNLIKQLKKIIDLIEVHVNSHALAI